MITVAQLDGKKDCFAAPHICSESTPECLRCEDSTPCAETAALLVHSVKAETIQLASANIYGSLSTEGFRKYYRPGFGLHPGALEKAQHDLLDACHIRHLNRRHQCEDEFEKLLKEFEENEEPANQPEALVVTAIDVAETKPRNEASTTADCGEEAGEGLEEGRYPSLPISCDDGDHEELVQRLADIAKRYSEEKDYLAVREEFVHTSLELNQHGLLAPAYRRQPRIPFRNDERKSGHEQLLIDQIVIDCHWLWCREERVFPKNPDLTPLFDPKLPFDCRKVRATIAANKWKKAFRVEDMLLLTKRQQHQLMQLRTDENKDHYSLLVDGKAGGKADRVAPRVSRVRIAINEWSERNLRIRKHVVVYEKLWISRELLGAAAKLDHIAELAGLMLGIEALNRKTVQGKLASLDAVLDRA